MHNGADDARLRLQCDAIIPSLDQFEFAAAASISISSAQGEMD